jgi:solute carrier family 12 (potassium/chloride transporter), member 4/6
MLPKLFDFLKGNQRRSLYFTAGLVLISIMAGSIDQVAPLVTIFYLLCYGGVNMACFLLDWLGSPNWRPKWKFYHKSTSFIGVIFCIGSMIIISWWASLLSVVGAIIMYAYLDRKS